MTRQSDVFLTLQERTELASHGKTDLFVSIHANSNPSRNVQGLEVYMAPDLSEEDKKEDQRRENMRLMAQHLDMKKTDMNLQKIVADMLYTQKQMQSSALARKVLYGVCTYAGVKNRGVKEARFFVVRNTLIPAILIETGYLTNPREERLLTSKLYRQKLAQGIARSILSYVEK
jgi:N-acetylmuramoyl-L-alanine amidase